MGKQGVPFNLCNQRELLYHYKGGVQRGCVKKMSTPPVNCFGSMNAHLYCVHVWSFAVEHVEVPVEIHDPIMAAHLSAMAQVQYAHSQAVVSQVFLHPFPRTCCLLYILHPLNFSGLNKWTS